MGKITCPDCGYVHECGEVGLGLEEDAKEQESKQRGHSIYFVPCRCGCGCGHTCNLLYGPYVKIHNDARRVAMAGELGQQVRDMRAAAAQVRHAHLQKIHARWSARNSKSAKN